MSAASKTSVYHVSVTTGADGKQVPAIVFKKPQEGDSFPVGYVVAFDPNQGGVWFPANDEGVLPHRERTSEREDLGLTWQFAK